MRFRDARVLPWGQTGHGSAVGANGSRFCRGGKRVTVLPWGQTGHGSAVGANGSRFCRGSLERHGTMLSCHFGSPRGVPQPDPPSLGSRVLHVKNWTVRADAPKRSPRRRKVFISQTFSDHSHFPCCVGTPVFLIPYKWLGKRGNRDPRHRPRARRTPWGARRCDYWQKPLLHLSRG